MQIGIYGRKVQDNSFYYIYRRGRIKCKNNVLYLCIFKEFVKVHTAPKATDSMVCIRASSIELSSPFLLRRALPARVQNLTCFTPTETNWVSESGLNSATNIRWL